MVYEYNITKRSKQKRGDRDALAVAMEFSVRELQNLSDLIAFIWYNTLPAELMPI